MITEKYLEDNLKQYVNKSGGNIVDIIKTGYEKVKDYFDPYKDYRPIVKKYIEDFGDWRVYQIIAFRKPIMAMLEKVLNFISSGKFEEGKKISNYDELYHLGLIIGIGKKGEFKNILVEKNERIDMEIIPLSFGDKYGELLNINVPRNKVIMFKELFINTQKGMGSKYFEYDPFNNNNCQIFAKSILEFNDLLTPEAEKFIFQPLDTILEKIPSSTPNIARGITQLGAFFANIGSKITGKGENYQIHAVVIKKPIDKNELEKIKTEFIGDKNFIRETKKSYRLRNIPKEQFIKGSFKSKIVNDKITIIFGKLKIKGGVVNKNLGEMVKERMPEKIKEAYNFISSLPKIPSNKKQIIAKTKEERQKLRKEWEEENKPEMMKVLNMGEMQRKEYKKQKLEEFNKYNEQPEVIQQKKKEQEEYGIKATKMVEKAKKYNSIKNLINDLEKKKTELKTRANKYADKTQVKEIIDNYNKDMENLKNYNFYSINNTELRDQLDKQYLKMWGLMANEPKIYGFLPADKGNKRTNPEYIKYVYENYGKAPPDLAMDFADILNDAISFIPGVGQIYDVVGKPVIAELKKDKIENIEPIDYSKGYEEFTNLEDNVKKAIDEKKEIEEKEKNINEEQNILKDIQKQIVGNGRKRIFKDTLKKLKISPSIYLKIMNKIAKKAGYNKPLKLSNDGLHKLEYEGVQFGRNEYYDYILYLLTEDKETAEKHRQNYLKRTLNIKGDWKKNPLSPNNLSRIIIWDEHNFLYK